jgi:hypothetical protein
LSAVQRASVPIAPKAMIKISRPRWSGRTVIIVFVIGIAALWIAVSALLMFEIQ